MRVRVVKKKKSHFKRDPDRLKALGCYIFAGTFTCGVHEHFDVEAHFEEGPFGVASARRNFPWINVHADPKTWPTGDYEPDLIYCNPPCAPWSVAGGKPYDSWREDVRTSCVQRAFELLGKMKPRVWTFESVRGAYTKGRDMIDEMTETAWELGYSVDYLLVDAPEHGVAQVRKRFFFIARNVEVDWLPGGGPEENLTVGDVLLRGSSDISIDPDSPYDKMRNEVPYLEEIREGERMADAFDRYWDARGGAEVATRPNGKEYTPGRPGFLCNRLNSKRPAGSLTGSATKIHPKKHRFISIDESKALCGTPMGFQYVGEIGDQYAQVAKAVMPPMGEYVARCVADAIEADVVADLEEEAREVWIYRDRVDIRKP